MEGYFFGKRLYMARKEAGLTQEELALRLGVTPQAISKWERGSGYPDLEMLYYLCDILSCSADYLINRVDEGVKLTEDNDKDKAEKLLDKILAEPLVLETGNGFLELLQSAFQNEFSSIHKLRDKMAATYGILLPVLRIRDNPELEDKEYRILAYDEILFSRKCNSMNDITFDFLCEQIEMTVLERFDRIFNRQMLQILIDNLEARYPAVIKGVVPEKVSLSILQSVLTGLVIRKKSIRNLVKIIEVLEDEIAYSSDSAVLIDAVRKRLYDL